MEVTQLIQLILECLLYLFHFTVVVVIIRGILSKKKQLNSAFFHLFLLNAVLDQIYFWEITVFSLKLPGYGYFMDFFKGNGWIAALAYSSSNYMSYCQVFTHLLIALNRLTVFASPTYHQKIWHYCWYIVFLLVIPFAFIFPEIGMETYYFFDDKGGGYPLHKDSGRVLVGFHRSCIVSFLITAITFVINIYIAYKYNKYKAHGAVSGVKKLEMRLALLSFVMFSAQCLRCGYSAGRLLFRDQRATEVLIFALVLITDFHALAGSASILVLSSAVRELYLQSFCGVFHNPDETVMFTTKHT